MENENTTQKIQQNFLKKYGKDAIPTGLFFIIIYLSFNIMAQITAVQKQIAELKAKIVTREIIHEISRQECQKFYQEIKSDIENISTRKILEYHQKIHLK